jgi:type IV secretory pathway VirB2 component (pilin)
MLDFSLLNNPTSYQDLTSFVLAMINMAINFAVVIAVVALIIAGFKYILAMGDEEKTENATKSLIFALVGLVIVFVAPLLVRYVTQFFVNG